MKKNVEAVVNDDNSDEMKEVINVLYHNLRFIHDKEVAAVLYDKINAIVKKSEVKRRSEPVNQEIEQDNTPDTDIWTGGEKMEMRSSESFWVKILRATAYVLLIVGAGGGLYGAYQVAETVYALTGESRFAFGAFLLITTIAIVATLISVAVIMVFLDMATDIRTTLQYASIMSKDITQIGMLLEDSCESDDGGESFDDGEGE